MKICIVTTRHISYNPRVLKEADALHRRGYDVTVVTVNNNLAQHRFDAELMQGRKWKLETVNFRKEVKAEKKYWGFLSLQQKFFLSLSKFSFRFGTAERAALKGYSALARLAAKQKADVYIAHHAEALGAAAAAAKTAGVSFAFDAEDFHTGMNEGENDGREEAMLTYLEAKYLPHCAYITAASKGIGEAYEKKYRLKKTTTVLNVFPTETVRRSETNFPVRFYWYSQVIGPNRSLETLLEAASAIDAPFELHLRGAYHSEGYKQQLQRLVNEKGLAGKVFVHAPILAEQIISDAANFDVGLALETDVSVNRNICVTNKIFSYLMAGLAIVGTDTYGQKDIFENFPGAVRICPQNSAAGLAEAMRYLIQHPDKLSAAKNEARRAAEERFNWDTESQKLFQLMEKVMTPAQKKNNALKRDVKPKTV